MPSFVLKPYGDSSLHAKNPRWRRALEPKSPAKVGDYAALFCYLMGTHACW
jgi:hypothetical protein